LFDPDGSLRLSPQVVDAAATRAQQPDFTPPPAARWPTVKSPLPYKATRFEPYWVKSNETMGEELFRHVIFEKEFKTPWGTRWRCAYILFIGGCGDVPPPPMKNPPKMPWETYLPLPDSREAEGDDGF
jgi:hypothetical protein